MMSTFKTIFLSTVLAILPGALAAPTSGSCDFGAASPQGWTGPMQTQWCGMISQEVEALKIQEDPSILIPKVQAEFHQANIKTPPESALPKVDDISQDPSARAAVAQMKANFPKFGSMYLTVDDIKIVYGDHIRAACAKTGVPEGKMAEIIWTESKGHPFVYGGLTQHSYVVWGQMADKDPGLKNRYLPGDNIMASAMELAVQKGIYGGSWDQVYSQHYQDPTAKARGY